MHALLQAAAHKSLVLAMGNPYLAAQFPEIETYLCAYSSEPVSERAMVKALFAEIPIGGHLPVTIPHIADRGAGILRPVRSATPGGNPYATP
jgi:beta-N-acetylhexosaminidase